MSENSLLMQLQADIAGIPVCKFKKYNFKNLWNFVLDFVLIKFTKLFIDVSDRSTVAEISTLGAAKAAGNAEGIDLWKLNVRDEHVDHTEFIPVATTQGMKNYLEVRIFLN